VLGKGEDTRLYTFDEDYVDATATNKGNLLQYNIGTLSSPYQSAPTVIYNDALAGNLQQNLNSCIAPDAHGGWWISQYRAADAATIPSLIHVNTSGAVDFNSGITPTLIENSYTGGMAVSYDGTRLAMGCNNELKIFDVTYTVSGVPVLTRLHSIKPGLGANTGGVSFDRAGNVYAVSDSDKRLGIWALPKVNNSFTTLAPSNMKIGIVFDKLEEIKDLGDIVNIYPNPAREFINIESKGISIEMLNLYDLNGQLLLNKQIAESKTQLVLTNLNPGIYILKIKTKSGTAIKRIVKN
jgi:WD40 repeat protein